MESDRPRLDSWKEIADYLNRDVRTVQRWERSEELPVHRILHKKRSTVYAYQDELDIWASEKEPTILSSEESWSLNLWQRLRRDAGLWISAGIFCFVVLLVFLVPMFTNTPSTENYNVVPLTSYAGKEEHATLSPNGGRIAFSWNGADGSQFDIYVRQNDIESQIRLTNSPERDYSPAWSNNGSIIAFLKQSDSDGSDVMLISPLGGPERTVARIATPDIFWGRQLSWSAGDNWLATTDRNPGEGSHLVLVSPATGEKKKLTDPPPGYWGDHSPSFSRDGRYVVFVRNLGEWISDLYLQPISADMAPEGEPKRLTFLNTLCIDPIWLTDDKKILFSAGTWPEMKFYELNRKNGNSTVKTLEISGEGVASASFSPSSNRLVFSLSKPEINIWKFPLSGGESAGASPAPLVVSSWINWSPKYSASGERLLFSSQRSGAEEIWVIEKDGSESGPMTKLRGSHCGDGSWSPNDERIAFHSCIDGHCSIWVKNAQICMSKGPTCEETPCCMKQITSGDFDDLSPSWSRDGKWIYFSSGRSGSFELWKVPSEGGDPVRVTQSGGYYAVESEDGDSIYYSKLHTPGIWKMDLQDKSEELVVENAFRHFALSGQKLYFVPDRFATRDRFEIRCFDLPSGKERLVADLGRPFAGSFAVAPDASALVWSQFDRDASDIMLINNFQP